MADQSSRILDKFGNPYDVGDGDTSASKRGPLLHARSQAGSNLIRPLKSSDDGFLGVSQDSRMYSIADKVFVLTTNQTTLSAAGNFRIIVRNPSSTYIVRCYAVIAANSLDALAFSKIYVEPTTGVPPVGAAAMINVNMSMKAAFNNNAPLSGFNGLHDVNVVTPLSGSNRWQDAPLPAKGIVEYNLAIYSIYPNTSVGFNIFFAGAAEASFFGYYWEDPV